MQNGAKILIVEDDPRMLRATSRLLAEAGYEVSETATGGDGWALAIKDKPDLMFVEIGVLDIDGVELWRKVLVEPSLTATFVALVSGAGTRQDEEATTSDVKAAAYITRPISDRELLARVQDMLRIRDAEHALGERVKELDCLYGISALVDSPQASLADILQGTVELIPPSWQYPEVTGACIGLDGREFRTANYSRESPWRQDADLVVRGRRRGSVDVCYLEERPESAEGSFLAEERNLLNAISERLGRIIERVWVEEELRESEATARALLNAPTDAAALMDTNGVILDANETMARRFGKSVSELVGTCLWDLYPVDVAARRKAYVEQVINCGESLRFEDERDGFWDDSVVSPVLDPDGNVTKVAVIARDISERKKRERLLDEQTEFIVSVFESLAHPFYVIDADDFTVKMANSAAHRGELPEAVKCYALTHGRDEPCGGQDHICPVEQIKQTGKPVVVEHVHYVGGSGRRYYEVHGHPILDSDGKVAQIIEYTLDITERVVANQALEDSEERFRIALENSNIVVYNQDRDLRYTWIYNPQLGYTPEGILGKTDAELLLPEDAARLDQIKRAVLESGSGARETVRTVIDGVDYYYNLTVEPLRNPNSDVVGITGASLDITDRKRTEDALKESEERFRRLVETMAEGLAVLDENGAITYVNDRFCEMSGYDAQELVGRNRLEIVDDDAQGSGAADLSRGELEQPRTYETALNGKSGQQLPVILSTSPLFDPDGSISGSFGVFTDITEQKTAAAALQRERDFVAAVLETEGALVIVLDTQGRVVRLNRACEELTGYSFKEVQGQHFWDHFLLPEEVEPVLRVFDELRAGQFPNTFENHWVTREGGRRLIAWSNTALLDATGAVEYVIGTGIDVTERRRAEEALRKAHDESEIRVQERTAALEAANRALQAEIAERKQIEAELRLSEESLEQRVDERTRELSTLLEISSNLALTLELKPLLDLILDQLKAVIDYDDASIFRFEGEELGAIAHRGAVARENMLQQRFSLAGAPFGRELILKGETIVVPDIRGDSLLAEDFRRVAGERLDTLYGRICSWMGVPLVVKEQIVGVLTLKHCEPNHFTPDQAELVLGFANQAAVALENNRLYEQAQALAALEERQRLARDLHDAVSQTLFSASLAAEVLPRLWENKPEEGRQCLEEVRELTRGALAEMRTLLLELRPSGLVEVALGDLLKQLVEAASSRARIPIILTAEEPCALQPDVQVALYRVAQEALSNIVKHAGAENAAVGLRCARAVPGLDSDLTEQVELWVQDDGRGFDPHGIPAECLGVSIMRERVAAIGAEIEIASETGQGTRVRVVWSAP